MNNKASCYDTKMDLSLINSNQIRLNSLDFLDNLMKNERIYFEGLEIPHYFNKEQSVSLKGGYPLGQR